MKALSALLPYSFLYLERVKIKAGSQCSPIPHAAPNQVSKATVNFRGDRFPDSGCVRDLDLKEDTIHKDHQAVGL
jgi:hypothetical protein